MIKIIKLFFSPLIKIREQWIYKKRLKELKEKDPFIYK